METKYLEGLGLDKEVISKIMAENGKDVEAEKAKAKSVESERDSLKTQLEETKTALKGFDGVNVTELNSKIADLTTKLADQEKNYAQEQAKREFSQMITAQIKEAGGKNEKAIMALLDLDSLAISKNQKDDIKKALDAKKESDAYLFGVEEPIKSPIAPIGGTLTPDAKDASMRSAMGLPPLTK